MNLNPWYNEFLEKYLLKFKTSAEEADKYVGRKLLELRREVKIKYNVNTEFVDGVLSFSGENADEAKRWVEIQLEAENLNLFY
ncbi:MAG: hypothetical protein ACTSW4_01390 [Candidatus Ranarchaeia archaeon]